MASLAGVADRDTLLKRDIRLQVRLTGDVLHDQEGESAFDVVETMRQTVPTYNYLVLDITQVGLD